LSEPSGKATLLGAIRFVAPVSVHVEPMISFAEVVGQETSLGSFPEGFGT